MYKSVKQYADEDVIGEFYAALLDNNPSAVYKIHIPKSDVFYVRAAIEAATGVRYTLDHVERAMYLEGYLESHEVLDPEREREYG